MRKPDTLTQEIGVLKRREVEARILAPVIDAMGDAFGREKVLAILSEAIVKVAREQGAEMAREMGRNDAGAFVDNLEAWTRDGALEIETVTTRPAKVDFNVKHCRYAEMYRDLGIPELGVILSCNRDHAMIEGFAPDAELKRTQTILSGGPNCDFRYQVMDDEGDLRAASSIRKGPQV